MTESKNVAYQAYTQQLRDYSAYAAQNGLKFNLAMRPTTKISGPLQEAIRSGQIVVVPFFFPTESAGESAYSALVNEFKVQHNLPDAAQRGFKWALGNAISMVADESHFDEVVELIRDKRHGTSRDMMVLRLSRLDPNRAVDVLIELLGDDEVAGQALIALGKLKARKARLQIERFVEHPNPWVREEAHKALAELNK